MHAAHTSMFYDGRRLGPWIVVMNGVDLYLYCLHREKDLYKTAKFAKRYQMVDPLLHFGKQGT